VPTVQTSLGAVPAGLRETARRYVELIREVAGERAISLTLFGVALTEHFEPARHSARSVLVLDGVDLKVLQRLSQYGLELGRQSIAAPLIMTPAYIKASLDTFPLELLEIQQQHLMLFGPDPFSDLVFDPASIRLECERELKAMLLGLRQGLLASAGRQRLLGQIEVDAGQGIIRVLRGMLWLKGDRDYMPVADLIERVEKIANRKLAGLRRALDASSPHDWATFEALYRDVEALGELVNGW